MRPALSAGRPPFRNLQELLGEAGVSPVLFALGVTPLQVDQSRLKRGVQFA
jgi:hypothetical protein